MSIDPGTRLGPYEITSRIGAGGMGEVFRARDTRLERNVAIKILPPSLAHDPQFRARFEREARTISQLNHPHICQIYDVGEAVAPGLKADGGLESAGVQGRQPLSYLVMELLEGESLADRLTRGAVPLPEVLRYGTQIADALAAAHRGGIVHRDLKPGNIMITKSGAKLLDFGLAKSATGTGSPMSGTAFSGETEHKPLTQEGTILGTFQYMAPEQLAGEEADARSDIFAFGAVLYEMLTGTRAFQGKNKTSLIGAIVSGEPRPVSALQPLTPPALEHVIARCLAKDPDDRWQTASDVAQELRWVSQTPSQELAGRQPRSRRYLIGTALLILALAAATLGVALLRMRRQLVHARQTSRVEVVTPPGATLNTSFVHVSPDGRKIVMMVRKDGRNSLWIRSLDSAVAQPIGGTEDGFGPFWSPDSLQLGFFISGKLKKVSISGGAPQVLCDAPAGRGGSWSSEGVIIFSAGQSGPLRRVAASGGVAADVFPLDATQNERSQRWPFFLPDGQHFLYNSRDGTRRGIYLASLDGKTRTRLTDADTSPAYAAGHLLYVRDSTLFAQRLDLERGRLIGEPVAIADQVTHDTALGRSAFSASDDVLTVTRGGADNVELTWLDRSGAVKGTAGPIGGYDHPDLSPDGRYIAVDRTERAELRETWLIDVTRGNMSRLTVHPAVDWMPAWSPDGRQIAFISGREGKTKVFVKPANGTGLERKLVDSQNDLHHFDWSSDGRFIVAEHAGTRDRDLWLYDLATGRGRPLVQSAFLDLRPRISPDGRWLAYQSNETGSEELYVLSLSGDGGRWQVSTNGGHGSRWRADGRELFFLSNRQMMSVAVATGERFEPGLPQLLFESKLAINDHAFDVSADGQRFLIPMLTERAATSPIELILNWTSDITK